MLSVIMLGVVMLSVVAPVVATLVDRISDDVADAI
jgi:hypothetical protein